LFNKIEEYQTGGLNIPTKPKKLKQPIIEAEYIDEDLFEEGL